MKVTLEAKLEGNVTLQAWAEVATFADLKKLAVNLQNKVAGIKKALPDLLTVKVEKVRIVTE